MALSEEQRKSNENYMAVFMSLLVGAFFVYVFGYAGSLGSLSGAVENIKNFHFVFEFNGRAYAGMAAGVVCGLLIYFVMKNDNEKRHTYKLDESAGTGGFMLQKDFNEYKSKYIYKDPPARTNYPVPKTDWKNEQDLYSKNMIMSNSFTRPVNSRDLMGNNNVLVVGGAGSGKSRFVIKPNMLQMNSSYVITDPSGEIINSLGKVISDNGYNIKIFNISDMTHSNCYNPLEYIRDEAGVNMLISCLINNTTKGEGGGDNQFFVDAEKLLYSACIFYLIDFCEDETAKNFAGVVSLINKSKVDEQNPNKESDLDKLFNKLPQSSLARKYYTAFKQAAGKTLKSIIISCVTRLQPFMTPQVVNLTKHDEMHLESLGNEKTVLFIITPQADRTYSFLASMLYSQLFETLYYVGEQQMANGGDVRLKVPVRCLMDEFANICEVPKFPSKLATMRKYNISATIVLQDIAQIESMYKDDWKTLVGNCSSIIFLGTQEPNTLKYFSEMLGKMTIRTRSTGESSGKSSSSSKNYQYTSREVMTVDELGRMDSKECIVFTQNMRPIKDKKYVYENHPYYEFTADFDEKNAFKYNQISAYDNTKIGKIQNLLKAQNAAAKYKKRVELKESKKVNATMGKHEASNAFTPGEKEVKKIYSECLFECQNQAVLHIADKISIVNIPDVPTKYLPSIAKQTFASIGNHPLVVFTNTTRDKSVYFGIGISNEDDFETALKSKFATVRKPQTEENGGYYMCAVKADQYEDYINFLLKSE